MIFDHLRIANDRGHCKEYAEKYFTAKTGAKSNILIHSNFTFLEPACEGALMRTLVVIIFLTQSCLLLAATQAKVEAKPKAIFQEISEIADTKKLLFPALVEAKVNSQITADFDAYVKKVLKPIGATVKASEVIMYLENKDPAFTYAAVAVRAPVSGVLSQMDVQQMSKVSKGERLFAVISPKLLKISVEVPSSQVALLKAGAEGTFKSSGLDEQLPVKVIGVSPVVDPRSGTATAVIEFDQAKFKNKEVNLPSAGTVGQVLFETVLGKVILIPENSLSYFEGKPTVRVIDAQNKSHRRAIELGEQREDLFVIKAGLKTGDKVVVRSNRNLKDDEEVEAENSNAKNEEKDKG